jgi:hypothetical protein
MHRYVPQPFEVPSFDFSIPYRSKWVGLEFLTDASHFLRCLPMVSSQPYSLRLRVRMKSLQKSFQIPLKKRLWRTLLLSGISYLSWSLFIGKSLFFFPRGPLFYRKWRWEIRWFQSIYLMKSFSSENWGSVDENLIEFYWKIMKT